MKNRNIMKTNSGWKWALITLLLIALDNPSTRAAGKDQLTQDGSAAAWAITRTNCAPGTNLLANSDFELAQDNGPAQWRPEKGKWAEGDVSDDQVFHSGRRSVRITCPPDGHHQTAVSAPIPVTPNQRYRLSIWSKATGGAFTYAMANFFGPSLPKESYLSAKLVEGPHDWTKSEFMFTAPGGAERIEISLGIKYGAEAWFDDIVLEPVPEGEIDNLVINSSFEIAGNPGYPDAWNRLSYRSEKRFFEPKYWGLDDTVAYHGRYSLRIAAPLRTDSVWYEGTPAPCTFSLYVKANQPDQQFSLRGGNTNNVFPVSTNWQRCSIVITKPSGEGTLCFAPVVAGGSTFRNLTWSEAGRFGKGLCLNGIDSYAALNDTWRDTNGQPPSAGTVELWLKPALPVTLPMEKDMAILKRDNCRPALTLNRQGALVWSIYDGKQDHYITTPAGVLTNGAWAHVAVTWGPEGQAIFVNGERVAHNPKFTGTFETRPPSVAWELCGTGVKTEQPFQGCMDELRISSRVRQPAELSFGSAARPYAADEHTILLVHFDESDRLADSSRGERPSPVFWVDAAQLEYGTNASPYEPGWRDIVLQPPALGATNVNLQFDAGSTDLFAAPFMTVDNKPFIPVWSWGLSMEDSAALITNGVNCFIGGDKTTARAAELGLKVIYCTPSAWRIREDATETGFGAPMTSERLCGLVREEVTRHKDNSAIISWFTCDEPRPNKGMTPELLLEMYKTIKAIGAKQPVYMNCAIGHNGEEKNPAVVQTGLTGFIPASDMIGLDIYPVPRMPIDIVARQTDIVRSQAQGKVVAMFLQFFSGGRWLREPTPAELISMWYLTLVHGARNIGLYSRRTTASQPWEAMQQLASETRDLTPILASRESGGIGTQAPDAYESGIHCLPKRYQGKMYLITVNAKWQTAHCVFSLPGNVKSARVKVLFENRQLPLANGSFADDFKPYERHVYEVE